MAVHSFLSLVRMTSVAQIQRSAMTSSAASLTAASVSWKANRCAASSYSDSAQSATPTGLTALRSAEKTRNASEAIRGCLSFKDFKNTGQSVGKDAENVVEGCVAKNSAQNERHIKCKVDVVVVGCCERMFVDMSVSGPIWLAREPGNTSSSVRKSVKPSWRTFGEALGFSCLKTALANEGTCRFNSA